MKLLTTYLKISTEGNTDIIDITQDVQNSLRDCNLREGQITLFVQGSTGGLTTMEYESNLVEDIKNAFENLVPQNADYAHHMTWGD